MTPLLVSEWMNARRDSFQLDKSLVVWTWPKFPMRHKFFQCSLNYAKHPPKGRTFKLRWVSTFWFSSMSPWSQSKRHRWLRWLWLQFPIWFHHYMEPSPPAIVPILLLLNRFTAFPGAFSLAGGIIWVQDELLLNLIIVTNIAVL